MDTRMSVSVRRRHELGAQTEKRFFRAAEMINTRLIARPPWLCRIFHATRSEDLILGVDAVAETDRGLVPIQIKSSARWVPDFERRHPNFSGIIQVIQPCDDVQCIAADCIILLWQYYQKQEQCDYERA